MTRQGEDGAGTTEPAGRELSGLLAAWVRGWAASRAVPPPTPVPGGWRLQVGLAGHRVRYVLAAYDDASLAELGRRRATPGTWIKAAADPADLRTALPAAWTMADTGHLMTIPFTAGTATPPASYTTRIAVLGDVIVAKVIDAAGEVAASGRLAPAGQVGVIDQVETAPAHRRRGLGSSVMRTLSHHAVRLGVHRGVLVATDEGRDLYRALGWTVRAPVAAAHVPEAGVPLT
ncbi:FR47-like protein [Micromonospora nigra]|uniref:FR47-like protein n=1 Tax=Micromonospora nigra TaxID=145857 RepID=A0A1C6RBJ0_9ACTN|nr:GNAT family N-acetyltransferase [Micromonospora nigra]SCL14495.1 FR47-like protein [Micromonospora nigra]